MHTQFCTSTKFPLRQMNTLLTLQHHYSNHNTLNGQQWHCNQFTDNLSQSGCGLTSFCHNPGRIIWYRQRMIINMRQLSLNHWVWNISREEPFGGQREVPDSPLCRGESLNCLYCAGLAQIQLTHVPKKGNGETAIGKRALLSGHKRNGQNGLAGINQVSNQWPPTFAQPHTRNESTTII